MVTAMDSDIFTIKEVSGYLKLKKNGLQVGSRRKDIKSANADVSLDALCNLAFSLKNKRDIVKQTLIHAPSQNGDQMNELAFKCYEALTNQAFRVLEFNVLST
jgi:hypothetical protein